MSVSIKTKEEIEILREGGKRLAYILNEVGKAVIPGVSSKDLNELAHNLTIKNGDKPAFLGYTPYGAKRPFPSSLCVSVNDEIVHGISNEDEKILKEGDIVSLDMVIVHKGLYTDMAITVPVGKVDAKALKLMEITKKALNAGIEKATVGNRVSDISTAVEKTIKPHGYGIVEGLAGHGVGYSVHEDPYVPNYFSGDKGVVLKAGMVLAIEPMVNEGGKSMKLDKDGYTYRTSDGSRSAHFEHTIVVTEKGPDILTSL